MDILRAAFNWAEAQNPPLILRNSLAKYRVPKERGSDEVPAPPTADEFRRILRHAPGHLGRCLLIQWYCGVRPGGEVSRMMWADVDFGNGEIRVVGARKGGPAIRYVPIHEELNELLLKWKEADERFLEKMAEKSGESPENGKDIQSFPVVHYYLKPVASLKTAWESTKKKSGITRRLRLYDFRHAWFTNALRAGADLKATSETGGHSRADTTMIVYQHVTKEQHREVIRKIPAIEVPPKLTTKPATTKKTSRS
jgi:integrase